MRLNLLPPERKTVLQNAHRGQLVRTYSILWVLFLLVLLGSLIGTHFLLERKLATLQDEYAALETPQTKERIASERLIRSLNAQLVVMDKTLAAYRSKAKLMHDFIATVPQGVQLSRIALAENGTLTVEGLAALRDDFLTFKSQLESSPSFANVESPLTTILLKENVRFELTASREPVGAATP